MGKVWILSTVMVVSVLSQVTGISVQATGNVTVSEFTSMGTVLATVSISDHHGRVTVYGVDAQTKDFVSIRLVQYASHSPTSTITQYAVYLEKLLDREAYNFIPLHFTAIDEIQQKVDFQILLKINDENDNAPVFTQQRYEFQVPRTAMPGYVIGTVTATDADAGQNAMLSYSIKINPDISLNLPVSISPQSGKLILLGQIGAPQISFVVVAKDNAKYVRLQSNVMVTLTFV